MDNQDQDTWWYVCKLCYRAFTGEPESRAHKQRFHDGIRGPNIVILSQADDLSPNVNLTRCTDTGTTKLLPPVAFNYPPVTADVTECVNAHEESQSRINEEHSSEDTSDLEGGFQDSRVEVASPRSHGRDRRDKTSRSATIRARSRVKVESLSPPPPTQPSSAGPVSSSPSPNYFAPVPAAELRCKVCLSSFPTLAGLNTHVLVVHVMECDETVSSEDTFEETDLKDRMDLESVQAPAPNNFNQFNLETDGRIHLIEKVDLPSETIPLPDTSRLSIETRDEHEHEQSMNPNPHTDTDDGHNSRTSTDLEDSCLQIKYRLRPRQPKRVARESSHDDSDAEGDWNLEVEDETRDTSECEYENETKKTKNTNESGEDNNIRKELIGHHQRIRRRPRPSLAIPPILLECSEDASASPSEKYKCMLCIKAFRQARDLKIHISHAHNNHLWNMTHGRRCECVPCYKDAFLQPSAGGMGTLWECKLCQGTMNECYIRTHVRAIHSDYTLPKLDPEALPESDWRTAKLTLTRSMNSENAISRSGVNAKHECSICNKLVANKRGLKSHIRRKHFTSLPRTCPRCQKKLASSNCLRKHLKSCPGVVETRDFLCPTCGRTYKTNFALKEHLRYHDESERKFVCDICPKSFFRSRNLQLHKVRHTDARTKMCPACGAMFKSDLHLSLHHKSQHTDVRPYKCTKCDASFKQSTALSYHAAKHTDVKSFACSRCSKSYETKIQLTNHMSRLHLGKGKQSSFICHRCPEPTDFPGVVSLRHHELEVHDYQHQDKFECKHCGRKFAKQFNLEQHEPTHTNERKYACEACGKTFKLSSHLRQHQFTHLPYEELPLSCDVCGKRFGVIGQLRAHKQRVHGQIIEVKRRGPLKAGVGVDK